LELWCKFALFNSPLPSHAATQAAMVALQQAITRNRKKEARLAHAIAKRIKKALSQFPDVRIARQKQRVEFYNHVSEVATQVTQISTERPSVDKQETTDMPTQTDLEQADVVKTLLAKEFHLKTPQEQHSHIGMLLLCCCIHALPSYSKWFVIAVVIAIAYRIDN